MAYVAGIDIGGTFTDCTIVDDTGGQTIGKARTTPEDNAIGGFFDSIEAAAGKNGEDVQGLLKRTKRITHGTTLATNLIVEEEGADIGLITSKGHEDTLTMMRGIGRATGQPPENILKTIEMSRPDPLVPTDATVGVTERVDSDGDVVVAIDEDEVREAVADLLDIGLEGFAVSYLWSFRNPEHERRTAEIIREEAGEDTFVSLSHEVSPSLGEYERTVGTCINSMVGPQVQQYITELETKLREEYDFEGTFLLMGANGGSYTPNQAANVPVMLIGSGPVGGVRGCQHVSEEQGKAHILATDMGGTSFELGIIQDSRPLIQDKSTIRSYLYDIPKLDVESIGAGGGSIADAERNRLRVGPESAGADPGPACYDRGGTDPTVTDADLLLGFIDPETTFGSGIQPSKQRAREAIGTLADELGQSPLEAAAGIVEVVNSKMANLIEKNVTGRGYDPRDFHVVSYGGAAPMHAAYYADHLEARSIIVPGEAAPVWSASGMTNIDIRQELEEELGLVEPFDREDIEVAYGRLADDGRDALVQEGIAEEDITFDRWALMRYAGQYHNLEIPVPSDLEDVGELKERFESEYTDRYSTAAVVPSAQIEIQTIRVEPVAEVEKFHRSEAQSEDGGESTPKTTREIYWPDAGERKESPVYARDGIRPSDEIAGPAIIDESNTTIVVPEGWVVSQNRYGDYVMEASQ